jgi:predicted AAA+ superfamily ATPase
MRATLERLIDEFQERELPRPVPRDIPMPRLRGKATALVGMRRSGKTWTCFQRMQELAREGVPRERLLYVNFEDDRLLPFAAHDFQALLDAYFARQPGLKGELCYLFLDEAQRVEGWDSFVRRVLDTENMEVYVTGSSSRLLGTEIATALRGRSLTVEVFPLSFRESLRFTDPGFDPPERPGARARALLENRVERHLRVGGFPEVQGLDDDLRRQVLRSYLDVALLRDVVERHRVTNVGALRALVRQATTSPATRLSVNRLYQGLRSQGMVVSKAHLYEYLAHLCDAYLLFLVPVRSRSEAVRRVNPAKAYVVDAGLLDVESLVMTSDRGALLETLVFLHLRRAGLNPAYHVTRGGGEVDFVVDRRGGEPLLVQSCWTLADERTREREVGAIRDAMRELRAATATVVTWQEDEDLGGGVRSAPAWRWLLRPPSA